MNPYRDIFVMFRQQEMSEEQLEREVAILNKLLFGAERIDNFVKAHEVLDLNRYKIISDPLQMKKMILRKKTEKPFIFFSNKN